MNGIKHLLYNFLVICFPLNGAQHEIPVRSAHKSCFSQNKGHTSKEIKLFGF